MSSEKIVMEKQYSMEIVAKFTSRKRILCSETMLSSGLTEPKRVMAEIQNTDKTACHRPLKHANQLCGIKNALKCRIVHVCSPSGS